MPPVSQDAFERHVYAAQHYVSITSPAYSALTDPRLAGHPITSFGTIDSATVLTVGLNPSMAEFAPARAWPLSLTHRALAERCKHYFATNRLPTPSPWFNPWLDGLQALGVNYENGSAAHLDLSPRPTRFVSAFHEEFEPRLFLEMLERDLWIFFGTLQLCPDAKLILLAGSATGKYYANEFLQRIAPAYGYSLDRPFVRHLHPGKGKVSWHCLSALGRQLPVFFCSASPSSSDKTLLPSRIRQHADALKRILHRGWCADMPTQ